MMLIESEQFQYSEGCLTTSITGTYIVAPALTNITIAGIPECPKGVNVTLGSKIRATDKVSLTHNAGVLYVGGMGELTADGAWESEMRVDFSW